jgi:hypothetical protein
MMALALALVSLACGAAEDQPAPKSTAPPASQAAAPRPPIPSLDACSLLTQAEAETALGKTIREPVRGGTPPVFSCSYVTPGGLDNVSLSVSVHSDARQAHDAYLMSRAINNYQEFSGLGDRAYLSATADVHVLAGRYELSMDVSQSIDKDAQVTKAKDLAARALERLPQ